MTEIAPHELVTFDEILPHWAAVQPDAPAIEDGGFAGFGQGVEWCVVGLDRNWAFNPACKAAKP